MIGVHNRSTCLVNLPERWYNKTTPLVTSLICTPGLFAPFAFCENQQAAFEATVGLGAPGTFAKAQTGVRVANDGHKRSACHMHDKRMRRASSTCEHMRMRSSNACTSRLTSLPTVDGRPSSFNV